MVSLDKTLIVQIITFLIIMFVLNKILFKDMLGIVLGREEKIKNGEKEIKNFIEKGETLKIEYEKRINEARTEAIKERERLVKEGVEIKDKIIKKANMEMEKMVSEFNERLNKEVEKVKLSLSTEVNNISIKVAKKVLGRDVAI